MTSVKLCYETIDQVLERGLISERREGNFTIRNYEAQSIGIKIVDILYEHQLPEHSNKPAENSNPAKERKYFSLRIMQDTELKVWDVDLTILLDGSQMLCDPGGMHNVDMRTQGYISEIASIAADYATMAGCRLRTDEVAQLQRTINEEVFPKPKPAHVKDRR